MSGAWCKHCQAYTAYKQEDGSWHCDECKNYIVGQFLPIQTSPEQAQEHRYRTWRDVQDSVANR